MLGSRRVDPQILRDLKICFLLAKAYEAASGTLVSWQDLLCLLAVFLLYRVSIAYLFHEKTHRLQIWNS